MDTKDGEHSVAGNSRSCANGPMKGVSRNGTPNLLAPKSGINGEGSEGSSESGPLFIYSRGSDVADCLMIPETSANQKPIRSQKPRSLPKRRRTDASTPSDPTATSQPTQPDETYDEGDLRGAKSVLYPLSSWNGLTRVHRIPDNGYRAGI